MTDSLLGFSRCQIFGQKVYDLEIVRPAETTATNVKYATTGKNLDLNGLETPDDVKVAAGETVLVKDQKKHKENGVYTAKAAAWVLIDSANNSLKQITHGDVNRSDFELRNSDFLSGASWRDKLC